MYACADVVCHVCCCGCQHSTAAKHSTHITTAAHKAAYMAHMTPTAAHKAAHSSTLGRHRHPQKHTRQHIRPGVDEHVCCCGCPVCCLQPQQLCVVMCCVPLSLQAQPKQASAPSILCVVVSAQQHLASTCSTQGSHRHPQQHTRQVWDSTHGLARLM